MYTIIRNIVKAVLSIIDKIMSFGSLTIHLIGRINKRRKSRENLTKIESMMWKEYEECKRIIEEYEVKLSE